MSDTIVQSRGEQKARKAILSLGLKPVTGINRVTFTRGRGMVFVIAHPEVYKSVNSDTHVVFGEMQVEDLAARAQQAAMEQELAKVAEGETTETATDAPAAVEEEEDDDEEVDASGLEEKDIELVSTQANVSRSKAIKALNNNDKDVVNAIMELTM